MPLPSSPAIKPILACWVISFVSLAGAIYYILSFDRDVGHSGEYLESAMMTLVWAIPACVILSVGCIVQRRNFSRSWIYFLNIPSVLLALVVAWLFAVVRTSTL